MVEQKFPEIFAIAFEKIVLFLPGSGSELKNRPGSGSVKTYPDPQTLINHNNKEVVSLGIKCFFLFLVIVQEKEVLFNYVVEEYISSRRQHLVRLFLDALTVGGPGGTPRPIEMHAHEPTRSE